MKLTILVDTIDGTFKLNYAYDCDKDRSYYDVYDDENCWLGELDYDDVEGCFDDDSDEYDMDILGDLVQDAIDEGDLSPKVMGKTLLDRWHKCDKTDAKSLYDLVCDMADFITDTIYNE